MAWLKNLEVHFLDWGLCTASVAFHKQTVGVRWLLWSPSAQPCFMMHGDMSLACSQGPLPMPGGPGRCWEAGGRRHAYLLLVCKEVLFERGHLLLELPELLLFGCQHLEVILVLLLPLQHLVAHLL